MSSTTSTRICLFALPSLAILIAACGIFGTPATAIPVPQAVTVSATEGWQNTHITVEAHSVFEVEHVSGSWTLWLEKVPPFGPEGGSFTCAGSTCCEPLPGAPSGSLIGKVGTETFEIGLGGPLIVETTGTLYLRMNDCDNAMNDNQGSIVVKVTP